MGGSCQYKGGYYGGAQAGHWTKVAGKPFCMPDGHQSENPSPAHAAQPKPTSNPLSGPVGTTYQTKGGDFSYKVTLVKVVAPAAPDNSFDAPPHGQYLAGLEFKITGVSGNANDDADNNASVKGYNSQVYDSYITGLAAGTDFNSGSFSVSPGESEIGWVPFELPTGVKIAEVQWDASGIGIGKPATWTETVSEAAHS